MENKITNYAVIILVVSIFHCSACKKKLPPEVVTAALTKEGVYWATSGGCIIDDRNGTVSEKGICFGTSENPDIYSSHSDNSVDNGSGEFTTKITGLTPSTTYYIRAYALNEYGIGYGEQHSFTTRNEGPNQMSADVVGYGSCQLFDFKFSLEYVPKSITYQIKVRSESFCNFMLYFPEILSIGSYIMSSSGYYSGAFEIPENTLVLSESGTFNITEFDNSTGKLKGTFNFSGLNWGCNLVYVTNGQFEFYI